MEWLFQNNNSKGYKEMKTTQILITIFLTAFVTIFIYSMFQPSPSITQAEIDRYKAKIPPLEAQAERLEEDKLILVEIIDSLKKIEPTILTQIIYEKAEIDSIIGKDSTRAVQQYRKQLSLLQTKPDRTLTLTLREIAHGGLFMAELRGIRLNVDNLHNIVGGQDNLIGKQESIIDVKNNIIEIDSLTIASLELLVEEVKPSMFQSSIMILIYVALAFAGGLVVVL